MVKSGEKHKKILGGVKRFNKGFRVQRSGH